MVDNGSVGCTADWNQEKTAHPYSSHQMLSIEKLSDFKTMLSIAN